MNVDLIELGIIHLNKEIENVPGFDSLTVGSKKDLQELINFLDWCEEKNIRKMFGWRMVKINNEIGGYFYRLCPSLDVFRKEDVMLIRLTWPDLSIQVEQIGEEQ